MRHQGVFVLPPTSDGQPVTLVVGTSDKGKSVIPDHSELTMGLACEAFKMIGDDEFCVSATLSVDKPQSLRNFGLFESILLMAYERGQADAIASQKSD